MTTLKNYLKGNGFKTRFLNHSQTDFYVYVENETHYNNLLELIKKYNINHIYNPDVFKLFMVGDFTILIQYN